MNNLVKQYISLTKPGVLVGNAITAAAGFLLAARGHVDLFLFLSLFVGISFVIAAACVINNVFDQDIDRIMERTKKRAMASSLISDRNALIFGWLLCSIGLVILYFYTNLWVVAVSIIGFVDYVWAYGVHTKRRSVHGTLVGAISGAIPILTGYLAVTNNVDLAAAIIFVVLFVWQIPEFYSIAIYRKDEYQAAGIPVSSVTRGIDQTKRQIMAYTLVFVVTSLLLTPFGYTGYIYLAIMAVSGAYWLYLGIQGLSAPDNDAWARKMFRFSLMMLLLFSGMIALGPIIP